MRRKKKMDSKLTAVRESDFIPNITNACAIWRQAKLLVTASLHLKRHKMHMAACMTVGPHWKYSHVSAAPWKAILLFSRSLLQVLARALSFAHPNFWKQCSNTTDDHHWSENPRTYSTALETIWPPLFEWGFYCKYFNGNTSKTCLLLFFVRVRMAHILYIHRTI